MLEKLSFDDPLAARGKHPLKVGILASKQSLAGVALVYHLPEDVDFFCFVLKDLLHWKMISAAGYSKHVFIQRTIEVLIVCVVLMIDDPFYAEITIT